ncbi:MAG: DNA/RNA nuclease SfsA [Ruminococcus sp.]|nr:DNA/RNA nuclease SfsA [Ruminococcus sp.]
MKYENIVKGRFLSRPNRFIAKVMIDGKEETVHVKNTGRCRELLTENATVFLEKSKNPNRKTAYDLISVIKNDRLINMDSFAPNVAVGEFIREGKLFSDLEFLKSEYTFGNSRFDFYGKHGGKEFFAEVKGVTLEEKGVVRFPDAPTERGIKHLSELENAVKSGFEAYVIFVVQMKDVSHFEPNYKTHKEFGEALEKAQKNGVKVLCFDCDVTPESMALREEVRVCL